MKQELLEIIQVLEKLIDFVYEHTEIDADLDIVVAELSILKNLKAKLGEIKERLQQLEE